VKKAFVLVILALLLTASGCAGAEVEKPIPTGGESDIALPSGMEQVEYVYAVDPDDTDFLYRADVGFLKGMDSVGYNSTFGAIENAREAADVAAIVFSEVYEEDQQEEAPYSIYFNETADAWIVQGSMPAGNVVGGVFIMAIGRQSGEIIMLQHGK
jgi:hypothetical protein